MLAEDWTRTSDRGVPPASIQLSYLSQQYHYVKELSNNRDSSAPVLTKT